MGKTTQILDKTEGLISNPKRMIALFLIIAVILVVFFVSYSKIQEMILSLRNKSDQQNIINQEIQQTGSSPSFTDSQYRDFANKLEADMSGINVSHDATYAIFNQMQNKVDILKLNAAFGVRDNETLSEWLHSELWLSVSKINKMLAAKGIDYIY
jgi:hypothetical protein